MTITGSTGNPSQRRGSFAGESLWANIYPSVPLNQIPTFIFIKMHILMLIRAIQATGGENTQPQAGHIDILVNVKELV
jgi:hypothetical protein